MEVTHRLPAQARTPSGAGDETVFAASNPAASDSPPTGSQPLPALRVRPAAAVVPAGGWRAGSCRCRAGR